ncbi:MAG: Crp/Fnr family transcriptional regulator [Terriglobales bacterium]
MLEMLARSGLFQGMSKEDINAVLNQGSQTVYHTGRWLFREGERAKHFFLLIEGRISLTLITPDGIEVLLTFITPGGVCGRNALRENSTYAVSARAANDIRVAVWSGDCVRQLVQKYPRLGLNMVGLAFDLLQEFAVRYSYLLTKSVRQRTARALAELARHLGSRTDHGVAIAIHQRDLAELAGTTVYSVSRVLNEWGRRGLVQKGRGRLIVVDMDALLKDKRAA